MTDITAAFASLLGWQSIALGVMTLVAATACALYLRQRRVSAQYRHAIDHMTQGLCMWSPDGRLVLRNETYVKMYGLAPEIVRAGSSLRGLIDHRIKAGSFSGNPDQYVADLLSSIAKGKIINSVREHNGRYIAIVNHPMENGGWVATHEDVTARRQADLQRISMEGQIARRAMLEAAILAFRERIESVLKIVSDGAGKMQSAAVGLLGTSEKTTEHTRSAIRASDRASENVETAASAATELSASIAEIVAQLTRTTEVVRAATGEAGKTNDQIANLAEAVQKIGDVVRLISDIAAQTNLLALNATIEAARAGDAGRGFAVVASEVKSLAVQTAKATEEIAGQITAVQSSTTSAVGAIGGIAERMHEISAYTTAVAASVEEQNSATREITQSVASAADGAATAVSTLGQVEGAATATRTSAETVLGAAQSVESAVARLRNEVETFLGQVAA